MLGVEGDLGIRVGEHLLLELGSGWVLQVVPVLILTPASVPNRGSGRQRCDHGNYLSIPVTGLPIACIIRFSDYSTTHIIPESDVVPLRVDIIPHIPLVGLGSVVLDVLVLFAELEGFLCLDAELGRALPRQTSALS